jgi:hypothetical protein
MASLPAWLREGELVEASQSAAPPSLTGAGQAAQGGAAQGEAAQRVLPAGYTAADLQEKEKEREKSVCVCVCV